MSNFPTFECSPGKERKSGINRPRLNDYACDVEAAPDSATATGNKILTSIPVKGSFNPIFDNSLLSDIDRSANDTTVAEIHEESHAEPTVEFAVLSLLAEGRKKNSVLLFDNLIMSLALKDMHESIAAFACTNKAANYDLLLFILNPGHHWFRNT
ncbi:unnamed protein product [Clavelina lepadiformis]|uniref:Uncharacterized protein n=1 Tax=Clavelina lepadiformis TaxID=159417 RepID=A0ABP0GK27_CLALP